MQDRNFDNQVERFKKRIYGSLKGEFRLELIKEDLTPLRDAKPLNIFDAGCGLAQMAIWFAKANHKVIACDISKNMLASAKESIIKENLEIELINAPAQELANSLPPQDLILMHAILEWLAKPLETLERVTRALKSNGYLSLLFFNHHNFIYRNALKGTWRLDYILNEAWIGKGKKLTPPHPQKPEVILNWLEQNGFRVIAHTGIRLFYDFLDDETLKNSDIDKLLELERRYAREETFKNMGRYIHILAKRDS